MALKKYYSSLYQTLKTIQEEATALTSNKWKIFNEDVGEALTLFLAAGLGVYDFYFRYFVDACFLPNDNPTNRQFLYELIGYKEPYFKADELIVRLHWTSCGIEEFVVIPKYTSLTAKTNSKEYKFIVKEDYIIPPLTTQYLITLSQGEYNSLDVEIDDVLDAKVKISDKDIDFDLVSVVISNNEWTQCRNIFYESNPVRKYSLEKETDGIYLYLDKNWKNYVDTYNKTFVVHFIVSDPNFNMYEEDCLLFTFDDPLYNQEGVEVAYGEYFDMNIADSATSTAEVATTLFKDNRVITLTDFKEVLVAQPEILLAAVYDWDTEELVNYKWEDLGNPYPEEFKVIKYLQNYQLEPYILYVYAISKLGNLSIHTKDRMYRLLKTVSDSECNDLSVYFFDVEFVPLKITVYVDIGGNIGDYAQDEVRKLINLKLISYFTIGNIDIGKQVSPERLASHIYRSDSRIVFTEVRINNSTVHIQPWQVPILGEVVLIFEVETKMGLDANRSYLEDLYVSPSPEREAIPKVRFSENYRMTAFFMYKDYQKIYEGHSIGGNQIIFKKDEIKNLQDKIVEDVIEKEYTWKDDFTAEKLVAFLSAHEFTEEEILHILDSIESEDFFTQDTLDEIERLIKEAQERELAEKYTSITTADDFTFITSDDYVFRPLK